MLELFGELVRTNTKYAPGMKSSRKPRKTPTKNFIEKKLMKLHKEKFILKFLKDQHAKAEYQKLKEELLV